MVQIKSSIRYGTHYLESLRPKALQILRFSGFCVTQPNKIEHMSIQQLKSLTHTFFI